MTRTISPEWSCEYLMRSAVRCGGGGGVIGGGAKADSSLRFSRHQTLKYWYWMVFKEPTVLFLKH